MNPYAAIHRLAQQLYETTDSAKCLVLSRQLLAVVRDLCADLETTDAPAYETTALIPRPRVIYAAYGGSDPT